MSALSSSGHAVSYPNFGLLLLVLFFTFSRSECPCPKSWTGRHCFDAASHWQVRDFKLVRHPTGHWVLWVRFKAIKQDPRIERPSASASVDWLPFEPTADLSAPGADHVQEDPPGYSREARGREGGRRYFVWIAPDGTTLRSRRGAWAHAALAPPSPPSPSQGGEAGSSGESPAHSARGSVSPVAGRA